MNDWGEYDLEKLEVDMRSEGVLQAIKNNNPAITAVRLTVNATDYCCWADVGEYIGKSDYVRHLKLLFDEDFPSQEDVRVFCKGLACNNSIKSLEIAGTPEDDFPINASKLFEYLLPFFANNEILEMIELGWIQNPSQDQIVQAIDTCLALKSVKIVCCVQEDHLEALTRAICKKSELQHLSINDCTLTKRSCLALKSMLGGVCAIKSLDFSSTRVVDGNIANVTDFAVNRTVRCLKLERNEDCFVSPCLSSLGNVRLNALVKLEMSYIEGMSSISVLAAIKQMAMLESVLFRGFHFDDSWKELFKYLLKSSLRLHELKMQWPKENVEESLLCYLSSCLLNNTSLKILGFCGNDNPYVTDIGWRSFLQAVQTMIALERLDLHGVSISDATMKVVSKCLSTVRTLKHLTLHIRSFHTSQSWNMLTNVLSSHAGIQKLNLYGTATVERTGIAHIESAGLRQLHLKVTDAIQVEAVATFLQSQNCSLEELHLKYDDGGEHEPAGNPVTNSIIRALRRNSMLKNLEINYGSVHMSSISHKWSLFSDLLCNTSSVAATESSNHTLQSLTLRNMYETSPPGIDVYSMLHLNRNNNKNVVARQKIIQNHSIEDFDFIQSSIPVAISSIGKVDWSRKLSSTYGILRKQPHMIIIKSQKKRKATD